MAEPPTPSRLSNDDFRKMLMTPRRGDEPATPSRFSYLDPNKKTGDGGGAGAGGGGFTKPAALSDEAREKKKKKFFPKKTKEEGDETPSYRDRAKERREGIVTEYDEIEQQLKDSEFLKAEDLEGLNEKERQRLIIERSKYLGGDVEHTHLVKGLDYALLAKVKDEMEKKQKEEAEEKARKAVREAEGAAKAKANPLAPHSAVEEVDDQRSPMARSLHDLLFTKKGEQIVDSFLPGRMTLVYELGEDALTDLPTLVKRSKDDIPYSQELLPAQLHPEIMGKLHKVMIVSQFGVKAYKKMMKKEKLVKEEPLTPSASPAMGGLASRPPPASIKDEDENIFDDVDMTGVHIPKVPLVAGKLQTMSASDLFVDRMDVEVEPEHPQFDLKKMMASLPAQPDPLKAISAPPRDSKLKKLLEEDAYGDFIGTGTKGFTFAELDEEEEEELAKVTRREEEEERMREEDAQPKAKGFRGKKGEKGEKGGKKLYEEKLDKQLKSVEGMIVNKEGGKKLLGWDKVQGAAGGEAELVSYDPNSYEARLAMKRKAGPEDATPAPTPKRAKMNEVPPSPFHKPANFDKTASYFK